MARRVFFWSVISGLYLVPRCGVSFGRAPPRCSRLPPLAFPVGSVHPPERPVEILDQALERQIQRRPPSDQHIVVAAPHPVGRRKPHHLAQTPAHAVALDRVADLLRAGKSHAHRSILAAITRLQHKSADGSLGAGRCGQKVCALPEPLHRRRGRPAPVSGAEPLPSARTPGGQNLAATRGLQAGAKSMTALAHQLAGLIGPLHEIVSVRRRVRAYTEAGQGRQMGSTPGWQASRFASNISEMASSGRRPRVYLWPRTPAQFIGSRALSASYPVTLPADDRRVAGPRPGCSAAACSARLAPLLVIVALIALAYGFGLHRDISFETLVRHNAEIDRFIGQHAVAAVAAYIALYIVVVSAVAAGRRDHDRDRRAPVRRRSSAASPRPSARSAAPRRSS